MDSGKRGIFSLRKIHSFQIHVPDLEPVTS